MYSGTFENREFLSLSLYVLSFLLSVDRAGQTSTAQIRMKLRLEPKPLILIRSSVPGQFLDLFCRAWFSFALRKTEELWNCICCSNLCPGKLWTSLFVLAS